MWGRMNAPYNLWKSAGVISMNDAFIALIIEFAFFAVSQKNCIDVRREEIVQIPV